MDRSNLISVSSRDKCVNWGKPQVSRLQLREQPSALWTTVEYELVDANGCQGIQKVRVEPATRNAVATCNNNNNNSNNNNDDNNLIKLAFIVSACFFHFCNPLVILSGANNEQFKGLLVQGRQSFGMTPVGTFTGFTSNTKPSNCTPQEVPVTKVSNLDHHPPPFLFTNRK